MICPFEIFDSSRDSYYNRSLGQEIHITMTEAYLPYIDQRHLL